MPPTKKNHINPCFWTALWNASYYDNYIKGKETRKLREQKVFTLDFRSQKILLKKVEDVHYVDNLGLILANGNEIINSEKIFNSDDIYFSEDKKFVNKSNIDNESKYLLDAEIDFTSLEEIAGYKQLLKTIRNSKIENEEDRIYLACFIIYHQIRSENFLGSLINKFKQSENPKLESFLHFRKIISNPEKISNAVLPIVNSMWTLYTMKEFKFPLSDNPIVYNEKIIWVVLSPKHLLEIDKSRNFLGKVKYKSQINIQSFTLLRNTIIRNTNREIIFSDLKTSQNWKKSKTYHFRKNLWDIKY